MVLKMAGLGAAWLLLPVLTGTLWRYFSQSGYKGIACRYLMGNITMWAAFYVLVQYGIAEELKLSEMTKIWIVLLALVAVLAILVLVKRPEVRLREVKKRFIRSIAGFAVAGIVIACSVGFTLNESKDHTVERVMTMYATDSLYQFDPMTGEARDSMMAFEQELLDEQMRAPIEAYYAASVAVTKLHPAKFVRILLPVFLFPFYFLVYAVWGRYLFGRDKKRRWCFQIAVWMIYAIPLLADRSVAFSVYQNCWNGETLFFLGELPLAVLLLLGEKKKIRELEEFKSPYMAACYVVSALSGQLLYKNGFFFVTFIWAAALLVAAIKRWKDGSSVSTVEKGV